MKNCLSRDVRDVGVDEGLGSVSFSDFGGGGALEMRF